MVFHFILLLFLLFQKKSRGCFKAVKIQQLFFYGNHKRRIFLFKTEMFCAVPKNGSIQRNKIGSFFNIFLLHDFMQIASMHAKSLKSQLVTPPYAIKIYQLICVSHLDNSLITMEKGTYKNWALTMCISLNNFLP